MVDVNTTESKRIEAQVPNPQVQNLNRLLFLIALLLLTTLLIRVATSTVWADYPLFEAIRANDFRAVERALNRRANPNATLEVQNTLWGQIRHEFLDPRRKAKQPALVYATEQLPTDPRILQLLIDRGANPNGRDAKNWTPLMCAYHRDNLPGMKILLNAGADPTAPWDANHPLSSLYENALINSRLDYAQLLVDHYKDIDGYDAQGFTPLISAVSKESLPMVQYLLKRGANPRRKSKGYFQQTALELAERRGNIAIIKALKRNRSDNN